MAGERHAMCESALIGPQQLKFLAFYGNQMVHYLIHKSTPLVLVPNCKHINRRCLVPFLCIYININNILFRNPKSSKQFLYFRFASQTPVVFFVSLMYATCPCHLTLLDLVTQI